MGDQASLLCLVSDDPLRRRGRPFLSRAWARGRSVFFDQDDDRADSALLEAKRIKRVPVMREGRLVGIISRANIVRAVGATKGAPQHQGEGDDRSIRAGL